MTMSIMQQHCFSRIPNGKRLFDYGDIIHDDNFIIFEDYYCYLFIGIVAKPPFTTTSNVSIHSLY
jgi:hypothetical protein